ncbi:hypothetical protein RKE29_14545, partial [Streptomyces sp. B1866]|nr:hypothetical protein [Streptomyces sp. B1866]
MSSSDTAGAGRGSAAGSTGTGSSGAGSAAEPAPGADGGSTASGECPSYRGAEPAGGGRAVSERDAERAARPVLDALGLRGAVVDARHTSGAERLVTADPVLGQLRTYGWATTLQIGADGAPTAGAGMLSQPAKGDSYPLIGAAEALKALSGRGGARAQGATADCPASSPAAPDGAGA